LGLDPGQLRDIIDSLLAAGLIYDTGRKRDGQPVYKTTQMGKRLAEYPPAKEQH
jgi:predicted transcriptional regulator